jgi:hypothetical protein
MSGIPRSTRSLTRVRPPDRKVGNIVSGVVEPVT